MQYPSGELCTRRRGNKSRAGGSQDRQKCRLETGPVTVATVEAVRNQPRTQRAPNHRARPTEGAAPSSGSRLTRNFTVSRSQILARGMIFSFCLNGEVS